MSTGRTSHQCEQGVKNRRGQLADHAACSPRSTAHVSYFRNEVPNAAQGQRRNKVPRLNSALCFLPCGSHAVRHRKGNIQTQFLDLLDQQRSSGPTWTATVPFTFDVSCPEPVHKACA